MIDFLYARVIWFSSFKSSPGVVCWFTWFSLFSYLTCFTEHKSVGITGCPCHLSSSGFLSSQNVPALLGSPGLPLVTVLYKAVWQILLVHFLAFVRSDCSVHLVGFASLILLDSPATHHRVHQLVHLQCVSHLSLGLLVAARLRNLSLFLLFSLATWSSCFTWFT